MDKPAPRACLPMDNRTGVVCFRDAYDWAGQGRQGVHLGRNIRDDMPGYSMILPSFGPSTGKIPGRPQPKYCEAGQAQKRLGGDQFGKHAASLGF